ncbi:MAG: bifunctional fucokinase/L-fucose-1-P-guanylyltransferase [Mediterranea sp.]|jgi:galactokinase/mevalonate kinase-like predicted kinase|nr:bifunctional fucokinase/L-fucose-1-P-guanylyltransferase [Mediterranea sp.]
MQKLLSLPPNLVTAFHELEKVDANEWFCTSDPADRKLGSGGGTTWLLQACYGNALPQEKRILLHAGGQSRRLPAYATSGKILTPIPVFRWERGQRLEQNLLSLQIPLYEKIMQQAPESLHTLIASGDVYIRAEKPLQPIPEADVVCYGLWVNETLATHHGVFVSDRRRPEQLDYMLQKPSAEELEQLSKSHLFLMDIGIWLLSDRAVKLLMKRSLDHESGEVRYYDLYSDFGRALGTHPRIEDEEINQLSVAILPLPGGEFYHFGTSRELLSSTVAIQNKVCDQRQIMQRKVKPSPAIFVQNAEVHAALTSQNDNLWIENSHIPASWKLGARQIITGVPQNNWSINVPDDTCIDIVPIGTDRWAVRLYGFDDTFAGSLQSEKRFPVVDDIDDMGTMLRYLTAEPQLQEQLGEGRELWQRSTLLSADDLLAGANLYRLYVQREAFRKANWSALAANYEKSIFYQLDLNDAAHRFHELRLEKPALLAADAAPMQRMHNRMLRAQIDLLNGKEYRDDEHAAFGLLREGLLTNLYEQTVTPTLNVAGDQIVWGRSPVRIDVAGGWTDTPPYSLFAGGNVVNMAIELNGQPPLQVYVKPATHHHIILRSIDMGAIETVTTYEQLQQYNQVGSPFSIPKAALTLAGFSPLFSSTAYASLEQQLQAFGSGIELTLLSAIPAGSGLGTSSILASTVLGALNDFCGLMWDKSTICNRTLVLEQLLTTGGGWQDQYGGVLHGIKLLQTEAGFLQNPSAHWLPEHLFTQPAYRDCHLLYYTGITRTAKGILAEIVRAMFLNSSAHLSLLEEMKTHALDMAKTIQQGDFERYGALVGKSWMQNKALDSGTNPPEVEAIIAAIKDYTLGYKLPGAGGGGYLYMVAKDPQAAVRIRETLTRQVPNPRARFVEMSLSGKGFQVSRS